MSPAFYISQILQGTDVPLPRTTLSNNNVASMLQLVFSVAGGIALIIIVLAGLRFVVANGDPQSVAKSKNTIIYATLGLVICLSGFSIVTFVLRKA